jgi:hypothetical protein
MQSKRKVLFLLLIAAAVITLVALFLSLLIPPNLPMMSYSPLPTGVLVVATATAPVMKAQAVTPPDLRPTGAITLYWRTGYENVDRFPDSGVGMYFLISPTLVIDIQLRQAGEAAYTQSITWTGIPTNGMTVPYVLNFTSPGVYSSYARARWDYDGYTEAVSKFYTTYTNVTGTVYLKNLDTPSDSNNYFYNGDIKVGSLVYVYLPLIFSNPTPTPTPAPTTAPRIPN